MNRRSVLSMFALTLVALIGCRTYSAKQDFDLTIPWNDYRRIVVHSRNGSVALTTADVIEIRISGTKHAAAATLAEAEQKVRRVKIVAEPDARDASVLVVKPSYPELLRSQSVGASLKIRVPAPCSAEIQTGNGPITVSGLKDQAILNTSNGAIAVERVDGEVQARTSNAPVTVDAVTGTVTARTSNGRIVADSVKGDLTAVTTNGAIVAKAVRGDCNLETSNGRVHAEDIHGSVEATTSNGDVRVDAIPPDDGNLALRSTNGSIHAKVPAGLKADFDLRTSNGVVGVALEDVPLKVQLWSQNRVKAKMNGGGGARIVAVTSNGLVSLESR